MTSTFISTVLSPEIQTHILNCPLLTSSWMPNRHLKLTMFETSDSLPHSWIRFITALPSSTDGNVFPPGLQAKSYSHPWLLSFPHIINLIYQESHGSLFKIHPIISCRPLHIQLGSWLTLLCHWDGCNYLLALTLAPLQSLSKYATRVILVSKSCHFLLKVLDWFLITMASKRKTDGEDWPHLE